MEMQPTPADNRAHGIKYRLLRRIWGSLPFMVLVLLGGVIFVLQGWITSQGQEIEHQKLAGLKVAQTPTNVVTLGLTPGPINERINLPGVAQPWVSLKVVAQVAGKVVSKPVAEGQRVSRGTVLAIIDKRDYQSAYDSAKATFEAADKAYKRLVTLFREQVGTRAQLDNAETQLENARAAMQNAALNLERCTVRSPMDGIVNRLPIEAGQVLNGNQEVAEILQMNRMKISVGIPESDVDAVRRVKDFSIRIDALNGKTFAGTYYYLSRSADSLSRTYRLEIAVNNPNGEILPDMFARVEVVKKHVASCLSVPLFALVPERDEQVVYLADAGKARRVPVRTGIQEGWQVQVAQGLRAGEKVIVVGQRDISDGQPIKEVRTVASLKELDQ